MLLICNFKELKSNMERKKHTRYILQLLEHHQNLCKICNYNYFLFLRTLKDSTKLKMKFWLKDCDIQKYHYSMSSDVNKCYQAPRANRIVYWQNIKSMQCKQHYPWPRVAKGHYSGSRLQACTYRFQVTCTIASYVYHQR